MVEIEADLEVEAIGSAVDAAAAEVVGRSSCVGRFISDAGVWGVVVVGPSSESRDVAALTGDPHQQVGVAPSSCLGWYRDSGDQVAIEAVTSLLQDASFRRCTVGLLATINFYIKFMSKKHTTL